MGSLEANKKDLKVAKKEFKKLRKVNLIEIIIQLQEMILAYKAKIVEVERMLDERGYVIAALLEAQKETSITQSENSNDFVCSDKNFCLNKCREDLVDKICKCR